VNAKRDREKEQLITELCAALREAGRVPEVEMLRALPVEHLRYMHDYWAAQFVY
jgi:hypothetical protein